MQVRVELFGALRRVHRTSSQSLDVPQGCTVKDVLDRLDFSASEQRYLSVFLDEAPATPDTILHEDARIKILLPVGGGRPSGLRADRNMDSMMLPQNKAKRPV